MEGNRRSSIILWTGLAAAVTGITAIAVIAKFRNRTIEENGVRTRLRGIQDVLADCYRKISEIEDDLPVVPPTREYQPPHSTNGTPSGKLAYPDH